jgi:tetratricopeptide (TPR) repeat protein
MRTVISILLCCAWLTGCVRQEKASQSLQCLDVVTGHDVATKVLGRAQEQARDQKTVAAWVNVGEAWMRLARVQSSPRVVAAAQDCVERALEVQADAPLALRLRGLLLLDAHRFREASQLSRKLLAAQPDDVQSWGTLSDAELELGNITAAVDAAQQMVDRKPSLLSYGRAAHLRWMTGDREGSKSLYRVAIRAGETMPDPEPRAWMMTQAAWVFWHEGDFGGAKAGFQLAASLVPDYVPALQGLGRTALATADYKEAILQLERAQGRLPQPEAAWWLGDAYAAAGRLAEAKAAYVQVEQLAHRADPRTLALFSATRGQELQRVLVMAKRAFEERPDVYSKDVLAYALYRSGKAAEAAVLARELLAVGTPDARILYHAGLILKASGAAAEGGELMSRALALNPRFDLRLTLVLREAS